VQALSDWKPLILRLYTASWPGSPFWKFSVPLMPVMDQKSFPSSRALFAREEGPEGSGLRLYFVIGTGSAF